MSNETTATKHVSVHGFRVSDGRQAWLIDTPGFDDTSRSDTEILREIASALTELYKRDVGLAGVLYLHRIIDPKMGHSANRNLEIFKRLCGKDAMKGVSLVTTHWDGIPEGSPQWETAVERERKLAFSEKYWAGMIQDGADVHRHVGGRGSALAIIDSVMRKRFNSALAIQLELGQYELPLDQTGAGNFLAKEQEDLQARYEQEMRELEEEREQAMQQRDGELAAELATQEQRYQAQHAGFTSARRDLHVDFRQMRHENAAKAAQDSQTSEHRLQQQDQQAQQSAEQIKAQMDLIAQNVADIQEEMERRDKEHAEQIARLRKQARTRDREHEAETARLIEKMDARHEHEKRSMYRRMETLRKPPPPGPPPSRHAEQHRGGHGRRSGGDPEPDDDHPWFRVLKWLGYSGGAVSGGSRLTINSLPL